MWQQLVVADGANKLEYFDTTVETLFSLQNNFWLLLFFFLVLLSLNVQL